MFNHLNQISQFIYSNRLFEYIFTVLDFKESIESILLKVISLLIERKN